MTPVAEALAAWAGTFRSTPEDEALARRSLLDTVAVGVAARNSPFLGRTGPLGRVGRWAAACHVLDFDDLHMASTTHVSTVCLPVALGEADPAEAPRAYLAGAGVMARLGMALGWRHYEAGWHATPTAGALGAAVTAAVARGLPEERVAAAMALAVPAAGGNQRAFGTDGKALQVGMAADAGVRAAALAEAGATADPRVVEAWARLLRGGTEQALPPAAVVTDTGTPVVPGGLAIKLYPACYALQRPIAALASALRAQLPEGLDPATVQRIRVITPRGTVQPLVHHQPRTGLEGKFSLEYALATAVLDRHPGFAAFEDAAVRRPAARRLMGLVEVDLEEGGDWLLAGEVRVRLETTGGDLTAVLTHPPGSPERPPSEEELGLKLADCLAGTGLAGEDITWERGADLLDEAVAAAGVTAR